MNRLSLSVLLVALQGPAPAPKFTNPPGDETSESRALIDQAKGALDSGRTTSEVLGDFAFMPVHAFPRFRELVRDRAPIGAVTMVAASEPGELLHVRGTVRNADGTPAKQALLYAYQTSAKGWYSDKAAHIAAQSGDTKHARLFAYVKTDGEGRYELRTIRPSGYPETDLPAHIHVFVDSATSPKTSVGTEIRFEDDPRLTPEWRRRSADEKCAIVRPQRGADGIAFVTADFQLR